VTKPIWSGRFKKEMHPALKCFSYSLAVDGELFGAEIRLDIAWAKMLARIKLITPRESSRLIQALHGIEKDFSGKGFCEHLKDYEDVHTLIQSELESRVGILGKKIHTGRSRNDLVVSSTRIYLRDKVDFIEAKIKKSQLALISLAKKSSDAIVAGMTHLKKAQPVLMAHHLLAYVEMLEEDRERLVDFKKRIDVLPIGSAALAGSSLPLDQKFMAKELGFSRVAPNSMAAVSDRAFLVEFLSVLSILWMHLSRLSEDFILWNSEAFGYIELDDAFSTGSSLMPQKKNPDVFELIRGRSAVIFGELQALLVVQKGLPLAYNRDLQEDKPSVFDAIRKTQGALELLALTVESATFNSKAMEESVQDDNLYATDILEYLVRKNIPFSVAHETVGKLVRYAGESQKPLRELSVDEWKKFSKAFDSQVYELFDPQVSVKAKKTIGSTNPVLVKKEIARWDKSLNSKLEYRNSKQKSI
jgi:argininosuccinate lyase